VSVGGARRPPPAEGSFDVVRELVARSGGNAWLVSKCGPSVQKKTVAWLRHHGFHEHTGMPPDQVRFCLERREKAVHAKKLGLTVFVDDRLDAACRALTEGHHIEIRGFGTFKVRERRARRARNPRSGDEVMVPAKLVPVFKPSKELKAHIASAGADAPAAADPA